MNPIPSQGHAPRRCAAARLRDCAAAIVALAGLLAQPRSRAVAQPTTAPGGATYVVIVNGASGEPQYAQTFLAAATAIDEAARTRFGVPAQSVIWLGEDTTKAAGRMRGRATKENVDRELVALSTRVRPGDQLWIVLIGHGSGEGLGSRFNLVGPDLTAADFARLLDGFRQQHVAFVNASSASGDFVKALAGPNRAVVTATKSALERNESLFARHFAAALRADGADVDKDGRLSLLEAYGFARRETARAYETDNRLLTEHAQLDDNGDGVASAEPGKGGDGSLASVIALGGGSTSTDPRVTALVGERRALEAQVAALRAKKPSMETAAYEKQLETLLLDLARKNQQIRAAEGRKP